MIFMMRFYFCISLNYNTLAIYLPIIIKIFKHDAFNYMTRIYDQSQGFILFIKQQVTNFIETGTKKLTFSSATSIYYEFQQNVQLLLIFTILNIITMPKIYEIYPSQNRFYLNCCVAGPSKDIPGMIYIYTCSLGIVVPFCVFVVGQNWNVNPALPIIFLFCVFLMYFFMYLTSCSNPGIIPKRPFLQLNPNKFEKYLSIPSTGSNQPVRLCETCHIIRPKRTSHCSSCRNCVQIFDHHCGFLGTCIGKRNYRYFMLFITSIFLALCLFIVNMVVFIIQKSTKDINQTAIIVIVSVVSGVIGLPILGFLIFHIYLTIQKKTTRQLLKHIETQEDFQNQWCSVDPPVLDLFDQITEQQAERIKKRLEELAKPIIKAIQIPQNNINSQTLQHGNIIN